MPKRRPALSRAGVFRRRRLIYLMPAMVPLERTDPDSGSEGCAPQCGSDFERHHDALIKRAFDARQPTTTRCCSAGFPWLSRWRLPPPEVADSA
jgi:hypothetical protein